MLGGIILSPTSHETGRMACYLLSFVFFSLVYNSASFCPPCFCATGVQKCVGRRTTALTPMGIDEKKNMSQLTIMGTYINTLPLKEYVNLKTLTLMENNFLRCDRVQLRYGVQVKGDCEFLSHGLTSQESMDTNSPISITNNKKTANTVKCSGYLHLLFILIYQPGWIPQQTCP